MIAYLPAALDIFATAWVSIDILHNIGGAFIENVRFFLCWQSGIFNDGAQGFLHMIIEILKGMFSDKELIKQTLRNNPCHLVRRRAPPTEDCGFHYTLVKIDGVEIKGELRRTSQDFLPTDRYKIFFGGCLQLAPFFLKKTLVIIPTLAFSRRWQNAKKNGSYKYHAV